LTGIGSDGIFEMSIFDPGVSPSCTTNPVTQKEAHAPLERGLALSAKGRFGDGVEKRHSALFFRISGGKKG
jgi:hypothetical protein